MAVFNAAFPILASKVDAARAFAKETMGEQRSGFEGFQKRADVTRETWSIPHMPDGSAIMLVWFESVDPDNTFAELAQASSQFAVWFRERVQEINGIDLTQPPEGGPELVLDWSA